MKDTQNTSATCRHRFQKVGPDKVKKFAHHVFTHSSGSRSCRFMQKKCAHTLSNKHHGWLRFLKIKTGPVVGIFQAPMKKLPGKKRQRDLHAVAVLTSVKCGTSTLKIVSSLPILVFFSSWFRDPQTWDTTRLFSKLHSVYRTHLGHVCVIAVVLQDPPPQGDP